jgi:hemoglobin
MNDEKLNFGYKDHSFTAAGGLEGIHRLVNIFYDYMEAEDFAKDIRAMHPKDLTVTRDKLTLFLTSWLGGPKLLQEKYGPISIPRVHMPYAIGEADKQAWLECMRLAIDDQNYSSKFAEYLMIQLKVPANRITTVCAYHFEKNS